MTVTSANPEILSELDRPNSYIGKVVPRPNLERLMQGRGLYVSDMELPRMAHVVFLRSPHAHAKIIGIDATEARRMPGVIAVVTGEELAAVITPWVGVLSHLKGLKSAPQHAIAIDRVCWQGEAVAAIVATSRAVAEDAAEIVAGRVRGARCGDGHAHRARSGNPGHSFLARRQSRLRAQSRCRHRRCGVRRFRRGGGSGFHLWPAHRRDPGAARGRGRLERGRREAHDLPGHAGAAHGAEHRGPASAAGGTAGSRGLQGRRRLLRHQGPHLRRRNGDLCAVETAAPADQIRRRPGRKLQYRYSCPRPSLQGTDRRQARRHHHGVRDRRSHRHRSLFDVSAHQRHRSQPGRQPRRRPLCDEELSRPRPRRVPEQERDVPVPRRRPSHRMLGDGRPGRSGGGKNRDGSGGNPPPQSDRRRCLPLRVAFRPAVRAVVASRRDEQIDDDDGL